MMALSRLTIAALLLLLPQAHAAMVGDIVVENDLIKPEEIFDFVFSTDSTSYWTDPNVTKYYCIYRNLWTPERQPAKYPALARVANPVMYSATKQFLPWLKNRATTRGVEVLAESGYTDIFQQELVQAGPLIHQVQETTGFFVNQEDNEKNYEFFDGIEVNADFPWLSAIAGMQPSPDWYTGFYLFDTVDEYDRTFWDQFRLMTYPWDAGTDGGDTYTSLDRDMDPPENVARIFPENAPNGNIFVSPDGEVLPVAEWECILYTCDAGVAAGDCRKPNWPPANGCDVLKYPGCDAMCDPAVDMPCQECVPKPTDPEQVFFPNCCQSNYEAKDGNCDASSNVDTVMTVVAFTVAGMAAAILLM